MKKCLVIDRGSVTHVLCYTLILTLIISYIIDFAISVSDVFVVSTISEKSDWLSYLTMKTNEKPIICNLCCDLHFESICLSLLDLMLLWQW